MNTCAPHAWVDFVYATHSREWGRAVRALNRADVLRVSALVYLDAVRTAIFSASYFGPTRVREPLRRRVVVDHRGRFALAATAWPTLLAEVLFERTADILVKSLEGDDRQSLEVAQTTRDVMTRESRQRPGPDRLANYYYHALLNRGLINCHGRVEFGRLMQAFAKTIGGQVLSFLQQVPRDARDNWLRCLLNLNSWQQPPLRHILLMRFLEKDVLRALDEACLPHPRLLVQSERSSFHPPAPHKRAERRRRWTVACGTPGRGSLRARYGSVYSWLWRHDREFLQLNPSPRSSRRAPPASPRRIH